MTGLALGLVLASVALGKIWKAVRADLDEQLDLSRLGGLAQRAVIALGRFGMAAVGIVGAVVGAGLVYAAMRSNPNEAKGFGDALRSVQSWSYGSVVLIVVAIGLVAFGLFELVEARYRRIHA
jgi:hypothetical protein